MSENTMRPSEITKLLLAWNSGDQQALDQLMPLVFNTLHQIARQRFHNERSGHTLQPTAVVNELYLRFLGERQTSWQNRAHFFGAVSEMIRRILLDSARKHRAVKRGADRITDKPMEDLNDPSELDSDQLLAIDRALEKLAENDPRQNRIVHLKFFVGMTTAEVAEIMDLGERTVKREWAMAKAWLYRELN